MTKRNDEPEVLDGEDLDLAVGGGPRNSTTTVGESTRKREAEAQQKGQG